MNSRPVITISVRHLFHEHGHAAAVRSSKQQHFPSYRSRLQTITISDGVQQTPIEISALGNSWMGGLVLHSHWLRQDWVSRIPAGQSVQCLTTNHWSSIWNALCLQVTFPNWKRTLHGHGSHHKIKTWQPWTLGYISCKASILWLSDLQWSSVPLHLLSPWAASETHCTWNDSLKYPLSPSS